MAGYCLTRSAAVSGGQPTLHLGEAGPTAIRIPDHELTVYLQSDVHGVAPTYVVDMSDTRRRAGRVLTPLWDTKGHGARARPTWAFQIATVARTDGAPLSADECI